MRRVLICLILLLTGCSTSISVRPEDKNHNICVERNVQRIFGWAYTKDEWTTRCNNWEADQ